MSKSLSKLYVGHKDREGTLLHADRIGGALAIACARLSREFGGCSSYDVRGHYVLSNGALVSEDTTVLEVAHEDGEGATDALTCIARWLADCLEQECVLIASTPLTVFDFVKP